MSSISAFSPHPLPPQAGLGLKPAHYANVLAGGDAALPAWVEIHPQNYFADGGPSLHWLEAVADRYPVSFHSTGLSIGSADGPDARELDRLARLAERVRPAMISDHLSWSITDGDRMPDLLPLPYTHQALAHFADGVARVQDRLGRAILIENPSRYLAFAGDEMDEADFLSALCRRSGCGLLLDINNIIVSATNLGLDAASMLDAIDPALVGEVHLAGHAIEWHDGAPLCIDDHGSAVSEACWALYDRFLSSAGAVPTLIEWDTNLPDFAVLMADVNRAGRSLERASHVCAA